MLPRRDDRQEARVADATAYLGHGRGGEGAGKVVGMEVFLLCVLVHTGTSAKVRHVHLSR